MVDAASYCSAPPLETYSRLFLPPRLTRAQEARRPRAPLREVKREVRKSKLDSAEYAVDASDEADIKLNIRPVIMSDPRQLTARIAAIAIRQPPSAASSEEAQRPSTSNSKPSTSNYRMQPLCSVPSARVGPADPPRRPGRPKWAKSRRTPGWQRSPTGLRGALRQSPSGRPPVPNGIAPVGPLTSD